MIQIFNTSFETSRKILLLLSVVDRNMDVDIITTLDLITTYSKNYDLGDENLHGDNRLSFCEVTARRELIKKSIKELAFKGLIDVLPSNNGFIYKINQIGLKSCASMTSIYSIEYLREAKRISEKLRDKSNQDIMNYANTYSTRRIKHE